MQLYLLEITTLKTYRKRQYVARTKKSGLAALFLVIIPLLACSATGNSPVVSKSISANALARKAPDSMAFSAAPQSIAPGASTTLNWHVNGASDITINPGNFHSTRAVGSLTVAPNSTTNYTLTATNSAGSSTA